MAGRNLESLPVWVRYSNSYPFSLCIHQIDAGCLRQVPASSPEPGLSNTGVTLLPCALHVQCCGTSPALRVAREVTRVEDSTRQAFTSFVICFLLKPSLITHHVAKASVWLWGEAWPWKIQATGSQVCSCFPKGALGMALLTNPGLFLRDQELGPALPSSFAPQGRKQHCLFALLQKTCSRKRQPLPSPVLTHLQSQTRGFLPTTRLRRADSMKTRGSLLLILGILKSRFSPVG